ncbi:zinc ABC transporter substrate-binding protein [Patescibacteria group bacterium]|nr:zinc ABC transporter substrate-binding protein [Patescibacteria group bacterium]
MISTVWKKFAVLCAVLFVVVVVVVVVAKQKPAARESGKLRVLTTFLPMYVFTANVAGEYADVENLLPGGVGPHEYAFTPADIQKIAAADVIVMNGLELEEWMDDLVLQSGTKAVRAVTSAGITGQGIAAHDAEPGNDTAVNPHVWLDPIRAAQMVLFIGEKLAVADPPNAPAYRSNAAAYVTRLYMLDREYNEQLSVFLADERAFVAFHPALDYLAERYSLTQVAVIEEFPGKEPSSQYLASVIDLIRDKKVRALFSEPQFSSKVVETVASETGRTIREIDTVETGDFATDTYEKVMRKNLQTFVAAFSEKE